MNVAHSFSKIHKNWNFSFIAACQKLVWLLYNLGWLLSLEFSFCIDPRPPLPLQLNHVLDNSLHTILFLTTYILHYWKLLTFKLNTMLSVKPAFIVSWSSWPFRILEMKENKSRIEMKEKKLARWLIQRMYEPRS